MKGSLREDGLIRIEVTLENPLTEASKTVSMIVDTGFQGFAALTQEDVIELGLQELRTKIQVQNAHGLLQSEPQYLVRILFEEEDRFGAAVVIQGRAVGSQFLKDRFLFVEYGEQPRFELNSLDPVHTQPTSPEAAVPNPPEK